LDAAGPLPPAHPAKAWPDAQSLPAPSKTSTYIDLATLMGRGFMAMMSAMAEDERLRIIKRTHEGRQIMRAKGVRMGRKPKLTPHQIKEVRQRIAKGSRRAALSRATASASARFHGSPPRFCVRTG